MAASVGTKANSAVYYLKQQDTIATPAARHPMVFVGHVFRGPHGPIVPAMMATDESDTIWCQRFHGLRNIGRIASTISTDNLPTGQALAALSPPLALAIGGLNLHYLLQVLPRGPGRCISSRCYRRRNRWRFVGIDEGINLRIALV